MFLVVRCCTPCSWKGEFCSVRDGILPPSWPVYLYLSKPCVIIGNVESSWVWPLSGKVLHASEVLWSWGPAMVLLLRLFPYIKLYRWNPDPACSGLCFGDLPFLSAVLWKVVNRLLAVCIPLYVMWFGLRGRLISVYIYKPILEVRWALYKFGNLPLLLSLRSIWVIWLLDVDRCLLYFYRKSSRLLAPLSNSAFDGASVTVWCWCCSSYDLLEYWFYHKFLRDAGLKYSDFPSPSRLISTILAYISFLLTLLILGITKVAFWSFWTAASGWLTPVAIFLFRLSLDIETGVPLPLWLDIMIKLSWGLLTCSIMARKSIGLSKFSTFVSWIPESSRCYFTGVIATSILCLCLFGVGSSGGGCWIGELWGCSALLFMSEDSMFCCMLILAEACWFCYYCCVGTIWGESIMGKVWSRGDWCWLLYLLFFIWWYLFFLNVEYPSYYRSITGSSGCLFISCSNRILEAFLMMRLACSGAIPSDVC